MLHTAESMDWKSPQWLGITRFACAGPALRAACGGVRDMSRSQKDEPTVAPSSDGQSAVVPPSVSQEMSGFLLRVGRDQDRDAFAALFTHFAPRLKSYLIRLGSTDAVAEELIQDVMLLVWRKAHQFDPDRAAATTWIYTIARNRRIDLLRRERRPDLDDDDPLVETVAPPAGEAVVAFGQDRDRLQNALQTLSEEQAIVVTMSFMEDKSHSMIAEELDIPLGTVKSRLRLAFKRLREALGEEA